jgi:hypothetical protein
MAQAGLLLASLISALQFLQLLPQPSTVVQGGDPSRTHAPGDRAVASAECSGVVCTAEFAWPTAVLLQQRCSSIATGGRSHCEAMGCVRCEQSSTWPILTKPCATLTALFSQLAADRYKQSVTNHLGRSRTVKVVVAGHKHCSAQLCNNPYLLQPSRRAGRYVQA